MKTKSPQVWTYLDVLVLPASLNASGIRWYARMETDATAVHGGNAPNVLRSDTKQGMRELIRKHKL